jgi:hypothetical protein
MKQISMLFRPVSTLAMGLIIALTLTLPADAGKISAFVGAYSGSAEIVSADGTKSQRDMSVDISEKKDGFTVKWTSTTYKPDGRTKEKSYAINFVPSDRDGIYSAAMERNIFGHEVQLDPMKGEPFVWGRIAGDTMTVFSLFVDDEGGYEMQQYDRTLAEGGLLLEFSFLSNGEQQRSVSTFLQRK